MQTCYKILEYTFHENFSLGGYNNSATLIKILRFIFPRKINLKCTLAPTQRNQSTRYLANLSALNTSTGSANLLPSHCLSWPIMIW